MPTPTDLVTDLPADFEVFGQAVDTSMADLKGGTSGQILAKNSNTDMDFVWIANDQGDITGITASSPLTGGGTSGAVTLGILNGTTSNLGAVQLSDSISSTSTTLAATANAVKTSYDLANAAIPKSLIDAAGDLIVGTAADTAGRLGIGTAGQVLKVNSGATALEWATDAAGMTNPMTTTGDTIYSSSGSTPARLGIGTTGQVLTVAGGVPSWAAPAGGGKVLQVVNASTNTQTTSSSATFADTTLTATITPTASTSKVLVFVSQVGIQKQSSNTGMGLRLMRGATSLVEFEKFAAGNLTTTTNIVGGSSITYLDSPATTSATTYKTQFCSASGTSGVTVQSDSPYSTITLMEIGA